MVTKRHSYSGRWTIVSLGDANTRVTEVAGCQSHGRFYLMAEFNSSSVWTELGNHHRAGLPICDELSQQLVAWSESYWKFLTDTSEEMRSAHEAEGLRLWRAVRAELGSTVEVGYAVFTEGEGKRIAWSDDEYVAMTRGKGP